MSTDDYVDLQKQVQLYGKKDIQKDDLRAISKLLRNEFFPERVNIFYVPMNFH